MVQPISFILELCSCNLRREFWTPWWSHTTIFNFTEALKCLLRARGIPGPQVIFGGFQVPEPVDFNIDCGHPWGFQEQNSLWILKTHWMGFSNSLFQALWMFLPLNSVCNFKKSVLKKNNNIVQSEWLLEGSTNHSLCQSCLLETQRTNCPCLFLTEVCNLSKMGLLWIYSGLTFQIHLS